MKVFLLISLITSIINLKPFPVLNRSDYKLDTIVVSIIHNTNLNMTDKNASEFNNTVNDYFNLHLSSSKLTSSNLKIWYGRVFDNDVYFYSLPDDNTNNILFSIEPSYFVQLTADVNSVFYKAKYMDINGYIKKKDVQVTSNTIKRPYLDNIFFRVYLSESQTMYYSPNTKTDIVKEIPIYTKNVEYIGSVYGETAIVERSNVWYYCKYTADKTYYGYVYSEGTDQMTKYSKNTEECDYVEFPDFNPPSNELSIIKTNSNSYNAIVFLICIPVGIFIIMIIKGGSILHTKKEKNKEVTNFLEN